MTENKFAEAGRKGGLKSKVHLEEWHNYCVIKYNKNPKLCKRCNTVLPYEKRRNDYCCRRCAALVNNKLSQRPPHGIPLPNCSRCGKKLTHHSGEMCKTCCNVCYKERIAQSVESGNYTNSKIMRKYLIIIRGYICEQCKRTEWEGQQIPIDTHHIDGDSENNRPENLKLLCPNCHSITNNYKAKNIGNGKRKRKKWSRN